MGLKVKSGQTQSQLIDLFLHVAEQLGARTDREIAELADVSVENVAHWKSGSVREFKVQKLAGIKSSLASRIARLKEQALLSEQEIELGLSPIEIEDGSGPADLQVQFRDQVAYDYLGHRFLYFEPSGALAWMSLIGRGYEQDAWLAGVESCAESWLEPKKDAHGACLGPIAEALGFSRRQRRVGLDLLSLGPGEGEKEQRFLRRLFRTQDSQDHHLPHLCFMPIDVSIPLLLTAARFARNVGGGTESPKSRTGFAVRPICADFEEGKLSFVARLPSQRNPEQGALRLVLILGNVFGNLRDEESFVRQKLSALVRPGDLVWLEIGLRLDSLQKDPLFRLTERDREETAAETNRRLLLEGPYRRWEAAAGRRPSGLEMRVWVREDDESCRIPGSCNFCHDLVLQEERRVCTMLYSRRYVLESLTPWLEGLGFEVLRLEKVKDSSGRARVAHLLLRRCTT